MRIGEIDGSLKPSVPMIELVGAKKDTIAVGWNDLYWETVNFNTSDFESLPTSGATTNQLIHVYTTGLYRIEFEIGFKFVATNNRSIVQLSILNNDVEIEGCRSIGSLYADGSSTDYLQLQVSKVVYLKHGDEIKFRFNASNITTLTIADVAASDIYYSRARISFIPFGGWNNNSGGNIVHRGIRR